MIYSKIMMLDNITFDCNVVVASSLNLTMPFLLADIGHDISQRVGQWRIDTRNESETSIQYS